MRGKTKKTFVEPEAPWFRGFVGFREMKKNSSVFKIVIFREGFPRREENFFSVSVRPKEGVFYKKENECQKKWLLVPHQEEGFFLAPVFFFASRSYEIEGSIFESRFLACQG